MSRSTYHAVTLAGPSKDRCSSCELLNILHKPKAGAKKRCQECMERENKKKMKLKHIPVHLRPRSLHEQTEKASRILAEETQGKVQEDESATAADGGFVSAARAPMGSSAGRSTDDEETVKLSDILELTFELLELVESHVGRAGSLEDVARFESQMKVLRKGRDNARSRDGHVEDKRAIILAFSIFTEHYTLTLREFDKLIAKNEALKQLAYDTAGLVRKSEAQFESYVSELKSLQGAKFEAAHSTKVELTKLRNEVTALKLELNLRTNELREAQLDVNATQEQMRRERERSEEMRKDKDHRITSLLAQLQQFSLDYSHEKGERLRLERENERLWNDRMAYRAEQIRSNQLSGAERALALERDAIEKREWMEWKKKAALREIQGKERLRQEAWEVRQGIEADAYAQLEQIRKDLGSQAVGLEETQAARISTIGGRTKEQRERERQRERAEKDRIEREREYWMELEQQPRAHAPTTVAQSVASSSDDGQTRPAAAASFPDLSPISSAAASTAHAQRWQARKSQLDADEEINMMIADLQTKKQELNARYASEKQPQQQAQRETPANDIIRTGNYSGGVESVLNNPRTSPALPLFSTHPSASLTWQNPPQVQAINTRAAAYNYTSTNYAPTAAAYQPSSIASSIPPPASVQPASVATIAPAVNATSASGITEADREAIRREVEKEMRTQMARMQQQQPLQQPRSEQPSHSQPSHSSRASSSSYADSHAEPEHRRVRSTTSSSRLSSADTASSSVVDIQAVEEGLRRSRKVRGESSRVYSTTYPLAEEEQDDSHTHTSTQQRTDYTRSSRVTVEDASDSESEDDKQERKYDAPREHRSKHQPRSSSSRAESRSRSRSPSPKRGRAPPTRRSTKSHSSSSRASAVAVSDDESEEGVRAHRRPPSHRSTRSSSRSTSRGRTAAAAPTTAAFTVDGKEAVPVRNFTLYSVKKTNGSV